MKNEFDIFFSDKANVSMSSYKVDPKTNLPILYLQDQKEALWEKFSEEYPNGMKRTTFMARILDGPFKYREDLGGLCSICSQYGYNVFVDISEKLVFYVKDIVYQVRNFSIIYINKYYLFEQLFIYSDLYFMLENFIT
jgi:hypothetical protein